MTELSSEWRLHFFPSISSTNDEAKKYTDEGHIVWAKKQTNGRGRLGHSWESLAGNLFCSWVIRSEGIKATGALSFITALSLGDTFSTLFPTLYYSYKWPNDVLVNGAKISGILLEQEEKPQRTIIGMGVNLKSSPEEPLKYPATSLAKEGINIEAKEFIPAYFRHFSNNLKELRTNGFSELKERWLLKAEKINQSIEVRLAKRTLIGVFKGLDENGCLILLPEESEKDIKISAGEVFYR